MNIDLIDNELSANNGYYYLNKGNVCIATDDFGCTRATNHRAINRKNLCFGTSIYEFNAKLTNTGLT